MQNSLSLRERAAPVAIRTSAPKNKTYKGRLFQGGLYRFEDRKEKQFMFENHYGHTIPRRESIVKRQVCIFILYYVMIKWKMLQKSLRIL